MNIQIKVFILKTDLLWVLSEIFKKEHIIQANILSIIVFK